MVYSGPNNTCQSASNSVTLISHPSITNNTISADQTICEGSAPATLDGTLPANGAGAGTYVYQWMNSPNGTAVYEHLRGHSRGSAGHSADSHHMVQARCHLLSLHQHQQ
ncbi:MAG: hypothetical protein MZV63_18485 [Marinilabiliales bacterium]|nr:hypothetical protein [Marinilabiliales bacterium]